MRSLATHEITGSTVFAGKRLRKKRTAGAAKQTAGLALQKSLLIQPVAAGAPGKPPTPGGVLAAGHSCEANG